MSSDPSQARRAALEAVVTSLPTTLPPGTVAVLPVSAEQWENSVEDAELENLAQGYREQRRKLLEVGNVAGPEIGRSLRPAATTFVTRARELGSSLELLATLRPDPQTAQVAARTHGLLVRDAASVVTAIVDGIREPHEPVWPDFTAVKTTGTDPVLAIFHVDERDLSDDQGRFSDARLLAHYRLRLPELQDRCNPILKLVMHRPTSVFTGASAVRDLATSASPLLTLKTALTVKSRMLEAFAADAVRTLDKLTDAAKAAEREWLSFERVTEALIRANAARTERDRAVASVAAYKHMSEGIVRRWVWTLLQLSGMDGDAPTVGALGEPAMARLGDLGVRIAEALEPAMRNADAHDDLEFDDDTGLLVAGDVTFSTDEIHARFAELDILQRGFIVGRLAAFADEPQLGGGLEGAPKSATAGLVKARQDFGHAGQKVRSFVRDRDLLTVVIDGLRPESCNPCFLALTQAAQSLPTVSRFEVCVAGREEPVIDLPSAVLAANYRVLYLAYSHFPDALPQVTFLPCITWARLACETEEQALRAAAWLTLNDAQHAILDLMESPVHAVRFSERLLLVVASASATSSLFAESPHLKPLARAQRTVRGLRGALSDGPRTAATEAQLAGISRALDRLGDPPAVLPTLDRRPLSEATDRHLTS